MTSVKGVMTWEATAELTGEPGDEMTYLLETQALEISDGLVAQLEKRYPIVVD